MRKHLDYDLLELQREIDNTFKSVDWSKIGILTNCEDVIRGHHRLLRSLSFRDEDYPANVLDVLRQIKNRDISHIEVIREYLADEYGVVLGEYASDVSQERYIVFSPEVFKVPTVVRELRLISVMMPFAAEFDRAYEAIRNACTASGYQTIRADDIWEESSIIQDIFNLIFKARAVIADFSGKNPNVMYEVGIAHTLGRTVIPITQSQDDVPFDLKHHRVLKYLSNKEGLDRLTEQLSSKLNSLQQP